MLISAKYFIPSMLMDSITITQTWIGFMTLRCLTDTFAMVSLVFSAMCCAQVSITDAWARATFPMANSGAIYLTLTNHADSELVLESVSTDEGIARAAQIHTTLMKEGMMKMRELEKGLLIPAQGAVMLQPGAEHIMLVGLKAGLKEGDVVPLRFQFSDGNIQSLNIMVKSGQDDGAQSHHHH